ncbi:uncharacterized protein K452DRAFT_245118 [Aplosporella prunicola CBS 121167]|uniref:Heterokaryon incompatibility domain-containing protein n=1 Tax=Aplosporella prunicola CBS 121167 TaxID=1176127 RepID=A0A6A6BPT2_9PEZI|nr:uncharacterized protein K452DRAFT_245118 [Aplosporella prunicola CBS 121167]KAF2145305.1 hypothetical protein K452DRAFT_245118 [Aplosporella prunicola CBS 121167]
MEARAHPGGLAGFMVINVDRLCLQDLPSGEEYVALSYVWGLANRPVSLKDNVAEFRRLDGLRIELPRTIQDAIVVTIKLGFRFLWVDSLCIVQDDIDTKAALIANMDAVYSHATLTLVAASGKEAQSGLSGVSRGRRNLHTQELAPGFRLGVLPFFEEEMMKSEHATRAWTYQETCLSPRCLIFLNGLVFFVCHEAVWGEYVMAELPNIRPMEGANTLGKNQDEQPLRRFQQHVTAYTSRNLSYQADGLNAFSGIANALSRYLGHTRIPFGLPSSVFDWAILWTANQSAQDLKRREGFPSWSWVGWQGSTDMAQDTDSEYDQKWLLKGTWIVWFVVNESGETVLLWDPIRDGTTVSQLVTIVGQEADKRDEHEVDGNAAEEEVCPSYGWPSPSNPYGRCLDERLLSMLPIHQAPETPSTIPSGLPVASLYFSTIVISLFVDMLPSHVEPGLAHVLDVDHNVCGFINVNNQSLVQHTQQRATETTADRKSTPFELLLLSVTPYGVKSVNQDKIAAFAPQYQQNQDDVAALDELDLPGDFEFLNIMLTTPQGANVAFGRDGQEDIIELTQRVGLGFLHKDAVRNSLRPGIIWKEIVLV